MRIAKVARFLVASIATIAILTSGLFSADGLQTVAFAGAQGENDSPKESKRPAKKMAKKSDAPAEVAKSDEEETLAFIAANNPKILKVLSNLKAKKPAEYAKAVREFHTAVRAINKFKEKDQPRYELEVKAWKLKSDSELLAARIRRAGQTKGKDAEAGTQEKLEVELRSLLDEQLAVQIAINTLQRDRQKARLDKMNEALDRLQAERASTVESRYQRMVQRSGKTNKKPASPKVAEDKPPAKPTVTGP